MHYHDFNLRARDWQADGRFQVEVLASPAGEMRQPASVQLDAGRLARPLGKLEFKGIRSLEELIPLGEELAALLLPEPVRALLLRSLDAIDAEEGLRLRLLLDDPPIADLPWEYVYLQRTAGEKGLAGFLALDPRIAFVRHEAMARPPGSLQATRPLKLVVGLSAPSDQARLDLEKERGAIEEALAAIDGVEPTFVQPLTVEALEAAAPGAHLFHFAGHGLLRLQAGGAADETTRRVMVTERADSEAPQAPIPGQGALVFEDGEGRSRFFPADKLAQTLASLRLVVLGACESGRRDGVNVWSGVAPALMRTGIPAAVAMQYEVYDKSAIAFARRFYQSLAAGLPVDEAVTQGRLAVLNLEAPFDLDFGVPVLYMRAADGRLFPAIAADPALAQERARLRVQVRQQVETLLGEMTGVAGEEMQEGTVTVDQEAGTVGAGGRLTGVDLDRIGGGEVEIDQDVDQVDEGGSVTGADLDELG